MYMHIRIYKILCFQMEGTIPNLAEILAGSSFPGSNRSENHQNGILKVDKKSVSLIRMLLSRHPLVKCGVGVTLTAGWSSTASRVSMPRLTHLMLSKRWGHQQHQIHGSLIKKNITQQKVSLKRSFLFKSSQKSIFPFEVFLKI